jgi:tetratricopeptide (TPR) repeat protein
MHLVKGDHSAAERVYRDAADYAPGNPEAQAAHGRILAILRDWEGAAARYQSAVVLAPDSALYRREHAIMLQRMGHLEEALAELESLVAQAPEDAAVHLAMADSLRDLGRNALAVEAYRRFLDLGAPDDPMRPIAEQFIEILSK